MSAARPVRVVVSRTRKGWRWDQVNPNGTIGAVAPKLYDLKANAKRAADSQAAKLRNAVVVMPDDE